MEREYIFYRKLHSAHKAKEPIEHSSQRWQHPTSTVLTNVT